MNNLAFNKIYVVESLGDGDRKTGTMVYGDIISRTILRNKLTIKNELVIVNSKAEFFQLFDRIRREAVLELVDPLIHFEIHGNLNGFVLNSGESVSWVELQFRLMELNILTTNNTFLTMSTCFGGHIFKIIDIRQWAPFWGYIGPMNEVYEGQTMAGFHEFFDELFTSGDILKATERLNENNDDIPSPFYFCNTEYLARRVYQIYEEKYLTDDYINIRVEDGLKTIREKYPQLATLSDEETTDMFRDILTNRSEDMKTQIMDHFLMYDIYPQLRK